MWLVESEEDLAALDEERALVATYVDLNYDPSKLEWVLQARRGFDAHVEAAWHLLIPMNRGYAVNQHVNAQQYNVVVARQIIKNLKLIFHHSLALYFVQLMTSIFS
ncbi:hypothetical protein [Thalassospira sp.]|uniref:hypothetical protein n=1 Tax=Thalassospira sp. TaxID=1912094 RepID=UPI002733023F|nr:hypothetical protein [Thalassospira sp.]MDP2697373.1 hypothetical protein [Thalassospira sp.]